MEKFIRIVAAAVATLVLTSSFVLVGCSSAASSANASAAKTQLQIYAANSLQKALPEVQALYTKAHPEVTFVDTQFEGSGVLVAKLKDAPSSADILITASTATMNTAVANGSIDTSTRADMFKNDLVICVKLDSGVTISSMEDMKTDAISSIAIGDPNLVPAGKYALQCFESAGLVTYTTSADGLIENIVWDPSIAGKINAGASGVGTVAKYVSGGECQVGFVYSSDVYRYEGIEQVYVTPANSHKNIMYPGALSASSSNASVAADFLAFCSNDVGAMKIFQKYGFELV